MSKPRNVKTWDSERQSPQKRQERSQVKGKGYPEPAFQTGKGQRALKNTSVGILSVSNSPHSHPHLLLSAFLIIAVLVGLKYYLIVILMYVSLMADEVEHLSMCFLTIYLSSLEKCVFRFLAYFVLHFCLFIIEL